MATLTHAAVAAMHKVRTMKRWENGRASVRMETSCKTGRPQSGFRAAGSKKCLVFVNFSSYAVFRKHLSSSGSISRSSLVRASRDKNVTPLAAAVEQNRHAGVCTCTRDSSCRIRLLKRKSPRSTRTAGVIGDD
jgi:hypothetical protein